MRAFKYSNVKMHELLSVSAEHLVDRYNRALFALIGKRTELRDFHIDCTGYSPEIAQELDDIDYLSPKGISKNFVIISMEQESLPIARCHFSSTYDFFREFIRDNRKALVTLTSLDSVFGVLENNIYRVESIQDLIDADTVRFIIDTPRRLIAKAHTLTHLIERFVNSDDEAWVNDSVFDEAINLANQVGNVNHNLIIPHQVNYKKEAYFTSHFGGIYIFKDGKEPQSEITLIFMDPSSAELLLPDNANVIDGTNVRQVHSYLMSQGYIEPLAPQDIDVERMRVKTYQVILDSMAYQHHIDLCNVDSFYVNQFVQENYESLPTMFHQLKDLVVSAERDEERIYRDDSILFYSSRISESETFRPYYSLINHLIANYTPHSYLRMFTFNRELFTSSYALWPPAKQQYVDKYIEDHIQIIEDLKLKCDQVA